jgi:carbamoyl-phosphate synthase large subunit
MPPLVVGVTGINALDNPGPGLGVARSLKEDAGLEVINVGLAYDVLDTGNYMDWVFARSYSMPYPSRHADEHFARLRYVHDRHGLDCVIPNLDAELPFYIRYAGELEQAGIRTFVPTMSQFRARSKERLPEVAKRIGVDCPRTRAATTVEELTAAVRELGLPVMVKGLYYEAALATTLADAAAQFHRLAGTWGVPVLVQEVVRGEELNVVAVGDGLGCLLGRVAMKKTAVTTLGKAWGAVTVEHRPLLDATARFAAEYRWRGPLEVECIVRDDRVWLIEINPRFPAWVYFATGVGVNLPARMVRHLWGQPVEPRTDYQSGRLFVRYAYEMVTDLSRFQQLLVGGETS